MVTKQSVGIDIAKKTFTACVCKQFSDQTKDLSEVRKFNNNTTGYNQLLKWVNRCVFKDLEVSFTMEATGIYYEQLAYHLHKLNKRVSVLLPNKVVHFSKSLNIKSKTDDIDAKVIAMMGCDRLLFQWTPPSQLFKKLRSV